MFGFGLDGRNNHKKIIIMKYSKQNMISMGNNFHFFIGIVPPSTIELMSSDILIVNLNRVIFHSRYKMMIMMINISLKSDKNTSLISNIHNLHEQ